MPRVSYEGRQPIAKVDMNIINIAICNASLRPILSPNIPNNTPPTGRATNAPANTPYDLINSAV